MEGGWAMGPLNVRWGYYLLDDFYHLEFMSLSVSFVILSLFSIFSTSDSKCLSYFLGLFPYFDPYFSQLAENLDDL